MNEKELLARAKQVYKVVKSRHKVQKKTPVTSATMFTQGNFTLVILNGNVVGISKKNNNDPYFNPVTGVNVALNRAVHSLLQTEQKKRA